VTALKIRTVNSTVEASAAIHNIGTRISLYKAVVLPADWIEQTIGGVLLDKVRPFKDWSSGNDVGPGNGTIKPGHPLVIMLYLWCSLTRRVSFSLVTDQKKKLQVQMEIRK